MWSSLNIEDKELIDSYTKNRYEINDLSFTNLYLWSKGENIEYKIENDILLLRGTYDNEKYYFMPLSKKDDNDELYKKVSILKKLKENKEKVGYFTESEVEKLKEFFEFEEIRDYFDYVYSVEDLAFLKGRKYSKKRNRINLFEKTYSYSYEKITKDNIADVISFQEEWSAINYADKSEILENELVGIKNILNNFEKLDVVGALIRVNGKIVAYTIGEILTDNMVVIHIEKALTEYLGSYQMINSLFLKNEFLNFKYVNREDDFGDLGLREAKSSYYPELMIKKYNIK